MYTDNAPFSWWKIVLGLCLLGGLGALAWYLGTRDDEDDTADKPGETVDIPDAPEAAPVSCESDVGLVGDISVGHTITDSADMGRLEDTVERFEWKASFPAPLTENTTYYWGTGKNHIGFKYNSNFRNMEVYFMDDKFTTVGFSKAPSEVAIEATFDADNAKVFLYVNGVPYTGFLSEPIMELGPMGKGTYKKAMKTATLATSQGDQPACVTVKDTPFPREVRVTRGGIRRQLRGIRKHAMQRDRTGDEHRER